MDEQTQSAPVRAPFPADADPVAPAEAGPGGRIAQIIGIVVVLAALGFTLNLGGSLWTEWRQLRREETRALQSQPIGYINIHPRPSYAQRPAEWYVDHDGEAKIWCGWTPGSGHNWFFFASGDIDQTKLVMPINGRDVIQAIDRPIVEVGGGRRWQRIPSGAMVARIERAGVTCVYPLQVLDKVEVVNDEVGGQPFLVAYSPSDPPGGITEIFDPRLSDGVRVAMGHSGYFHELRPLLFDRQTESLWVRSPEGLLAIAGPRKGTCLKKIGEAKPMTWQECRDSMLDDGRLLIGANRGNGHDELPPGLFDR